jgi:hypothetical protein
MYTENSNSAVSAAEAQALEAQAREDEAERKFDDVHALLELSGRVAESTTSEQFRQWMQARALTDEAWGRWALAVDAVRSARDSSAVR